MKHPFVLGILLSILVLRPALAKDTVYYMHTDPLGSVVMVTDANRNVVERTEYAPYGQVLNRPEHDGPGYTGHEEDAATGLTNMQARYDDKAIGRMLSTDPMDVDPGTGGNFNRYAYANDNPYRYVDPDGRKTTCTGSGKNAECVTTADTFDSAKSNGQTTVASAATNAAANAGKSRVEVPTGSEEKLGFVVRGSDGQEHVKTDSDVETQHGDNTAGKAVPEGATAVIHGHIESGLNQSNGMVDRPNPKQPMGDAQPLKAGLPNATVFKGKVGWHEIVNGQLQFRYPQGALNDKQTSEIQTNLNVEQAYFQHQ